MATVTYRAQPGIHKSRGKVPLAGTSHLYTVSKLLWPKEVEEYIAGQLIGTTLHICCGLSKLGDVRVDLYADDVDVMACMARLPFADKSFDTVLIDPPYNSKFQIMHDMLNELHRLARERIIFQHWFTPVDKQGRFKKCHLYRLSNLAIVPTIDYDSEAFGLSNLLLWSPRTYFGRVQVLSVLDRVSE